MKKLLFRFALPPSPILALICIFLCAALPAQAAPSAAPQEAPVNLIFSSRADYEATKQLAPKPAYQAGEEVIVFARLARPVGERIAIFSSSPDMTEHAINCEPESTSFTAVWSWPAPGTYTVKFISNSGRLLAQGKVNVIGGADQAAVSEEGASPQTPIHLGKVTWERVEMKKLLRQPMARYYAFTLTSDAVVKFHAFTNIDFNPKAKTQGVELWVNGELAGEIGNLVNTRDNPTIKIDDELDREYTLPAGEHTFHVLSSDADNGVVTLQINVSRIKK